MSYTPLPLHLEVVHEYDTSRYDSGTIEEDAVSMLSDATPRAGYLPYRPPNTPVSTSSISPTVEYPQIPNSPTRLPTPPKLLPIIWPGVYPFSRTSSSRTPSRNTSRTQTRSLSRKTSNSLPKINSQLLPSRKPSAAPSKTPSQSNSLRLFNFNLPPINTHTHTNSAPYFEALPWANSTHFRSTSDEQAKLIPPKSNYYTPPTKHYMRNPRHLRRPWFSGALRRFPWRSAGALFCVLLLTALSTSLILTLTGMSTTAFPNPSPILALAEILCTLFTLCALAEGVVVAFWVRMLRGVSVAELHDSYASTSPWTAVKLVLRLQTNRVSVGVLGCLVSLARGPLIQRALVTTTRGSYNVSFPFLASGVLCSLIAVLAILPLYHGYWTLGRAVSLNPIEVARAFGAPILEGVDGNGDAEDIAVERGGMVVRYGALEACGRERVLRVGEAGRVSVGRPGEGDIFG
ncbi:hypothetical protein CC86DRAFT_358112 [Ophiobolus disseminans]|uniref:Uncharacterized protein n=1 Tax=Ophiobolus disseminans TaxID=1469910 RepID=A0A6A6ZLU2_9PLEO|nr:hypothetical protein CC86DRAFT_358112 [Ophiobolus disseminans]